MNTLQEKRVEAREIAALLDYTPDYFSRIVPDLIANHGMPYPLPSSRRRARIWSRAAITRWLDSYADMRASTGAPDKPLPQDISAQRFRLHLAYSSEGTPA
ncbi:hypothetical protein ACO34A_13250 [Rhizobium sp. ACO-34A]|nr:hypothetical protein [Rhizobium sp. ACO-34A]ATN34767.1 hypothetical protein ACO34A_13250 [Rhizobium sp. ACO-34A]